MYISTREIRTKFLDFFAKNDHKIVSSSSLVPHNDPSLMFVNSGMVQFKNVFTGLEKRDYTKAASSQKSVRAGGKHNDLDNVGYTTRHHTFFEMLGNFSFGDYFKEKAIFYAWELLTKEFAIPKEKLYVTIYHDDIEAENYWKKIANLSNDRIIKIHTQDNFWSMGETGPCGPCSEIFYDHGPKVFGGLPGTKDQDGDRYVEIWNMVFMQYEQINKDTRINLPCQSIDTGMGLERIAAVLQGKSDNYETDTFQELIKAIEEETKVKSTADNKFSHRIIADHLRSCAFLIADGILPSNEGRGYVLRRIMRRSMRHIHQLGTKEPLMCKLLGTLNQLMADSYPELTRANKLIYEILKQEEIKFRDTLSKGLKFLEDDIKDLKSGDFLSGEVAFKLYDTYGFPLDLTQDILKSKKIQVSIKDFDIKMQEQKERARKSWIGSGEAKHQTIWFDLENEFGATEFLGYSFEKSESLVMAIAQDNERLKHFDKLNEEFWLITNQTPFYGESGGQKGDIGEIFSNNFAAKVIDTKKFLGIHAHLCVLESGKVSVNSSATLAIDHDYRANLKRNHSATHLLHSALKQVLGEHVIQKGSLVAHDRLRFDINHPKQITPDEIDALERKVNEAIIANLEVQTFLMNKEAAIDSGAMALFGEKYDEEVRVVSVAHKYMQDKLSIELCGGTHVNRTGDIGFFKIIDEGSIASGVRRIEAVTGLYALEAVQKNYRVLAQINNLLQSNKEDVVTKTQDLLNNTKNTQKQLLNLEARLLEQAFMTSHKTLEISEKHFVYHVFESADIKSLKISIENCTHKFPQSILAAFNKDNENCTVVIAVSKQMAEKFHTGNFMKKFALSVNGSGGGSNTLAQGSFKAELLKDIEDIIKSSIQ
jgi:alanyl-tRNA synthetase